MISINVKNFLIKKMISKKTLSNRNRRKSCETENSIYQKPNRKLFSLEKY